MTTAAERAALVADATRGYRDELTVVVKPEGQPCLLFVNEGVVHAIDDERFGSEMLTARDRALAVALLQFSLDHLSKPEVEL